MTDIEFLSLPDVAEALDMPITRTHQLVRDGQLVAMRNADGVRGVPADLIQDGEIVKSVPGVITLLRDRGYADEEIIDWLYRADESLPGTPIQALRENRGNEIKRRAQVAGF